MKAKFFLWQILSWRYAGTWIIDKPLSPMTSSLEQMLKLILQTASSCSLLVPVAAASPPLLPPLPRD